MVRLTRIYTRAGDNGKTSLGDGSRVPKQSHRIDAIGAVEEANAALGIARMHTSGPFDMMLSRIQNELFDLGADLCTPGEDFASPDKLRMVPDQVARLEREIDAIDRKSTRLNSSH